VRAAIDVLAHATGKRWLALGDMGEVGAQGPAFHREVGEYARAAGIEGLCAVGESAAAAVAAFGAAAAHFATVDDLAAFIVAQAGRGDTVLVKGSRFMRMERVVAALSGGNAGDGH
jgi:UDP-N-acetylmuramoyl-tripeptide--D-alanyl-D-alanine ligase